MEGLLEREPELAAVRRALADARDGGGGAVVLQGAAGLGKTSVLRVAAAEARDARMTVLQASGAELERDFPYGLAGQLLRPVVRRASMEGAAALAAPALGLAPTTATATAGDVQNVRAAAFHGLFWLVADLAERAPVLLAVDDAHWGDALSLEWLAFLARRIGDLPVALLVTDRRQAAPIDLGEDAAALSLEPLGPDAVQRLVAAELGREREPAFAAACATQTGGNPLLLRELLRAVRDAVVAPERVGELGGAAVAPLVRRRLERLPAAPRALADALSVLGPGAALHHAADLAGLDAAAAAGAQDILAAADLLDSGPEPGFRHPLVEAAVRASVPAGRRGLLHARAAELLDAEGAAAAKVATQLVESPPAQNAAVVAILRAAAGDAMGKGAPATAASCLLRALAEPPRPAVRAAVLLELGLAQAADRHPDAVEHLRAAQAAFADPRERALTALELGRLLAATLRFPEACTVLATAADEARGIDRELWLALEAQLKAAGRADLGSDPRLVERFARVADGLTGATAAERLVLAAALAAEPAGRAPTATESARLGRAALDAALNAGQLDPPTIAGSVVALIAADELEAAEAAAEQLIDRARARGLSTTYGLGLTLRSWTAWSRGRLEDAEADVRAALALPPVGGRPVPPTVAALIRVLLDRDEPAAAQAALEASGWEGPLPRTMTLNPLLFERGRLRAAQRRNTEAVADLAELGDRYVQLGISRPFPPWRGELALVEAAMGDRARAQRLAAEELAAAEAWNTPRAIGVAQRAAALVAPDGPDAAGLARSVATLEGSPAALELARSLVALGGALRRSGKRMAAREPLGRGMDLAARCGATGLATSAREELKATGARPRRLVLRGAESLTATERRVAGMAAGGMSNRQIAQDLFVTTRTVETHLRHAYRKLDIGSRGELTGVLSGPPAPAADGPDRP